MQKGNKMAKGFKTGGRNFEKGNPGGPGRPNRKITEIRKINKYVIDELLHKYSYMPFSELPAVVKDKETNALEALIASVYFHGVKNGDQLRLNFLLDRLIGKVKDEVDHNVKVDLHTQIVDLISKIEQP